MFLRNDRRTRGLSFFPCLSTSAPRQCTVFGTTFRRRRENILYTSRRRYARGKHTRPQHGKPQYGSRNARRAPDGLALGSGRNRPGRRIAGVGRADVVSEAPEWFCGGRDSRVCDLFVGPVFTSPREDRTRRDGPLWRDDAVDEPRRYRPRTGLPFSCRYDRFHGRSDVTRHTWIRQCGRRDEVVHEWYEKKKKIIN